MNHAHIIVQYAVKTDITKPECFMLFPQLERQISPQPQGRVTGIHAKLPHPVDNRSLSVHIQFQKFHFRPPCSFSLVQRPL